MISEAIIGIGSLKIVEDVRLKRSIFVAHDKTVFDDHRPITAVAEESLIRARAIDEVLCMAG